MTETYEEGRLAGKELHWDKQKLGYRNMTFLTSSPFQLMTLALIIYSCSTDTTESLKETYGDARSH